MNRVTEVLKAVLHPYFAATKFHLERGGLLHTIMQREATGQPYQLNDPDGQVTPYLPAIKQFWTETLADCRVLASERELISKRLDLVGHLDLLVLKKNHNTLIDYKTNAVTWTAKYQLGFYGWLCRENGITVSKCYGVAIQDNGYCKLVPYDLDWCILQARSIYNVFQILKRENQIEKGE